MQAENSSLKPTKNWRRAGKKAEKNGFVVIIRISYISNFLYICSRETEKERPYKSFLCRLFDLRKFNLIPPSSRGYTRSHEIILRRINVRYDKK